MKHWGLIACLCLMAGGLLWPAIYNGQPFFFPDTTAYVRGADAGIQNLTGISTPWSQPVAPASTAGAAPAPELRPASVSSIKDKSILAGRSVYYGALLYLGQQTGGFWLTIGIQALLLAAALWLALEAFGLAWWPSLPLLAALMVLFTPAPFFVSFLMPDIFAGLTILACSVLLTCELRAHPQQMGFWFALLTLALIFHTTHVLLAVVLFGAGLALYLWRHPLIKVRGLQLIGLALIAAYVAGAAFSYGVQRIIGEPPLSPPFLMARLIDDGPGYRYLKDTCPGNGFVVCRFLSRLPLQSDFFLWSGDPANGVFAPAEPAVRRLLSKEQFRFALAVVAHDPWSQIKVSSHNVLMQVGLIGLPEFNYTAGDKQAYVDKVPREHFSVMRHTPAYLGTMPTRWTVVAGGLATLVGVAVLVLLLGFGHLCKGEQADRIRQFALLVLFGVMVNAAVCGALSGPHDRYESRVMWLIPAVALIAHLACRRQRRAR